MLDFKSIFVAGVIGAGLYYLYETYINQPATAPALVTTLGTGFAIGAGVQIGVRMLGVS